MRAIRGNSDANASVEAHGLSYAYKTGGELIIQDLSFDFKAGQVTAMTGASGCGKSTLLYVLGGLLTPTAGKVTLAGQQFSELRDGERSAVRTMNIGFIFQDSMLDPSRTILDNVCEAALFCGMKRSDAIKRAWVLLDQFGLAHRGDHRPGEVSGGQAQRVALCRALLVEPQVILADEPTGNLDDDSAAVVWTALRQAAGRGCCVVLATHSAHLAGLADSRLVLSSSHPSDAHDRLPDHIVEHAPAVVLAQTGAN